MTDPNYNRRGGQGGKGGDIGSTVPWNTPGDLIISTAANLDSSSSTRHRYGAGDGFDFSYEMKPDRKSVV